MTGAALTRADLEADSFWREFIRMRPALLGREPMPPMTVDLPPGAIGACVYDSQHRLIGVVRKGDDGLTIPPVRPSKARRALPSRLVLVGVRNPDRPFRLRHSIVYVDAKHLRAIEREWRLVATTVEGGDAVEGVYLLTGRAS